MSNPTTHLAAALAADAGQVYKDLPGAERADLLERAARLLETVRPAVEMEHCTELARAYEGNSVEARRARAWLAERRDTARMRLARAGGGVAS